MKKLVFLISFIAIGLSINAQSYKTSLGLRMGLGYGLTVKHMLNQKSGVEGLFYSRWRGFNFTGLYEVHHSIPELDGLYWYVGGGAHIGVFNDRYYRGWGTYNTGRTYNVIGIDGIIGLEYVFEDIPVNLSLDWKPAINLFGAGDNIFWGDSGALSARYIF